VACVWRTESWCLMERFRRSGRAFDSMCYSVGNNTAFL